jgi:hypothetical protein
MRKKLLLGPARFRESHGETRRVVKEWDNSKFTPPEQEIIMKKSLADSGFTSDHVEARLPLPSDLGYFKEKRVSQSQFILLRAFSLFSNHVLDI